MNLPCKTCLVLPICRQLICPNPPRYVPTSKIINCLLTNNTVRSINCNMLRDYYGAYGSETPNCWLNIYNITSFFSLPCGEPYLLNRKCQ